MQGRVTKPLTVLPIVFLLFIQILAKEEETRSLAPSYLILRGMGSGGELCHELFGVFVGKEKCAGGRERSDQSWCQAVVQRQGSFAAGDVESRTEQRFRHAAHLEGWTIAI